RQTGSDFIKKSIKIFGKLYDYSLVKYVNSRTNVSIICKKHGVFDIKPGSHISYKRGCKYCSGHYTQNSFIEKADLIHSGMYDYSNVKFNGVKSKVEILCRV